MRKFSSKKVLFGLSVSLVLAMAIGSFALGEGQTPANTTPVERGAFVIYGGTEGADTSGDWDFSGTTEEGAVLKIHPQSSSTEIKIENKDKNTATKDRIEVTAGPSDAEKAVNITLNGVNIDTSSFSSAVEGVALKIKDDADFNVNILLADSSENSLASCDYYAGLQKNGASAVGTLTISGTTGKLIAKSVKIGTGGGAGIGGGNGESGTNNIKITGGIITATGVNSGAGIGGGQNGVGNNIIITGGVVTATGGEYSGSSIGRGSSTYSTSSGNKIDGDAVVIAESIEGFADSDLKQGLVFTRASVNIYGSSVHVTADVTIPANLTVGAGKVLTVDSGATFAVPDGITLATSGDGQIKLPSGGTLQNDGTIADDANISGTGNITTRTHFYLTDGTTPYGTDDYYQIYKAGGNVQKYKDLPNPDDTTLLKNSLNSDKFIYWYYLNGSTEVKIDNSKDVEPNQHKFYEKRETSYAVTIPTFENGSVTSDVTEAAKDETVTLTVTPAEGYELQENSLKVMAGTTAVTVTKGADGKYTFTMPNAAVTVSAVFEGKTHEISIDQPEHGTVELDKDTAKVGDEVGFTLTPDDGYELKEVKVTDKDGKEIPATEKDGKYTFKMPDSEVKIIAVFEGKSHEVTIDQPENGTVTIDPESPRTGDEVTITIKPDDGYKPDGAPVVKDEDGNEIELTPTGNPGEYKFIMPNSNLTIDVNFIPDSTPTPPEPTPDPTPDPSVNPDGGDGSGSGASSKTSDPFMGGMALALLGVATTGAVLVRKRK